VAAPTAGLHFTEYVIANCRTRDIEISETTLHVGAGTFKPVEEDNALNHEMHYEEIFLSKEFLEKLYDKNHCIIAVGTTSLRTLESIYWLADIINNENKARKIDKFPYDRSNGPESRKLAIELVLNHMNETGLDSFNFETGIYLTPTYKMRMIDGLITNFHLPKSTLLLLIASLVGEDWKKIYKEALENDYRFLSFGDSSLLIP
jgi:S-adenosylmethionine:tRNA ribosyltransferase-isomerase